MSLSRFFTLSSSESRPYSVGGPFKTNPPIWEWLAALNEVLELQKEVSPCQAGRFLLSLALTSRRLNPILRYHRRGGRDSSCRIRQNSAVRLGTHKRTFCHIPIPIWLFRDGQGVRLESGLEGSLLLCASSSSVWCLYDYFNAAEQVGVTCGQTCLIFFIQIFVPSSHLPASNRNIKWQKAGQEVTWYWVHLK